MSDIEILRRAVSLQNEYLVSVGVDGGGLKSANWSRVARGIVERRKEVGKVVDDVLKNVTEETAKALRGVEVSDLEPDVVDYVDAVRIQRSACDDAVSAFERIHWQSWEETFRSVTRKVEEARFDASDAMSRRPPPVIGFQG